MLCITSTPPVLVFLVCHALKRCPGELVEPGCPTRLDRRVLSIQLAWIWVHSDVLNRLLEYGLYMDLWKGLPESKRKLYDDIIFPLPDVRVLEVTLDGNVIRHALWVFQLEDQPIPHSEHVFGLMH